MALFQGHRKVPFFSTAIIDPAIKKITQHV